MKIMISAIGKVTKNDLEHQLIEEYTKRIKADLQIEDFKTLTYKSIPETKKAEAIKLLSSFSNTSKINIVLDAKGKQFDSAEFAYKFIEPRQNIKFIIGGAHGLDDSVKNSADHIISLSKMTMPHKIAKIILLEQIYRGFSIITNHPYSK